MNKHARECVALCDEAGLTVLNIAYGKHLKIGGVSPSHTELTRE